MSTLYPRDRRQSHDCRHEMLPCASFFAASYPETLSKGSSRETESWRAIRASDSVSVRGGNLGDAYAIAYAIRGARDVDVESVSTAFQDCLMSVRSPVPPRRRPFTSAFALRLTHIACRTRESMSQHRKWRILPESHRHRTRMSGMSSDQDLTHDKHPKHP